VAAVLEAIPPPERETVWSLLPADRRDSVLAYASEAVRTERLRQMEPRELAAVAQELELDDVADILQDLPATVVDEVLDTMDDQQRLRLEQVLGYPEDTAGGLMNVDVLTVRADVTLETVLRYLRRKGRLPDQTDSLIVVDRENRYQGTLPLTNLLVMPPEQTVEAAMVREEEPVPVGAQAREVAKLFELRDLLSAPVVNARGELLGRITVDDIVDVIREEGEHSVMSRVGLSEEHDMFAPVWTTTRRRSLWLGINLATALLAAWVIGLFEATIQQVVALAVLMPVVASMGGIAGTQTLTVVIRGMALGHLGRHNTWPLVTKEVAVGLINGALWALLVGTIAGLWFDDHLLAGVIAAAMIINQLAAALSGAVIPMVLQRFSIDPALAGGVVLTTVTDVVGFMTFLGLGTLVLLR
jgi:magnesium transporter